MQEYKLARAINRAISGRCVASCTTRGAKEIANCHNKNGPAIRFQSSMKQANFGSE